MGFTSRESLAAEIAPVMALATPPTAPIQAAVLPSGTLTMTTGISVGAG